MSIWLPLGLKILAKKAIGVNEKLKNSKIFYVARSPPLNKALTKTIKITGKSVSSLSFLMASKSMVDYASLCSLIAHCCFKLLYSFF